MAGGRRRGGSGKRGPPRQHPGTPAPAPAPPPPSATATTVTQRNAGAAPRPGRTKKPTKEPEARAPDVDSLGFQAMDRNVPGLSHVILQKLNMKSYEDYKSAMDGRKSGSDFGIRTYFEMFQKMEDTFKFCAECRKLPDALPDPKSLRRCKRCQNVYYCGVVCQRANWPLHKKFCKKLKLVALDRLVEWLVFTETWTKSPWDVEGWEDWFSMQEQLEEKLGAILAGRYMTLLWANAGKPRPEDRELRDSVRRLVTDFHSRPLTIGLGLRLFSIEPLAKALTVHVVGASHVETLNARLTDYDELTRMFPGHRGMEVVMVGVDVVDGPIMRPPLATPAPRGRVYLSSYKGLYHDFWESHVETKLAARPDLVVGFHPGFHACPDLLAGWLPTLLLLRDYRLPVLFTVYSEQELKSSLQLLVELEMRIMGYATNPFASLRPEQVYSSPNKAPVYCSSYYIALLGPVASAVPGAEDLEDGDGGWGEEPSAAGGAGGITPGLA
ncbi:putative protein MSS51 homolog, mitochondrial isoform X2 [Neopsephotus bourkii]|uniref:putative protein MSS51 homolog, mitochondrial isoform X2 n=1 Tax=Neopsephotus bourkii TaxID=309878 RepID=UPI002AA5B17A|nr:putative protein MSS51 homolog, mitochondrial isoform X2 [Neopsephotus bourkii]